MKRPDAREWHARRIFGNIPFLLEHFDARGGSFGIGEHRNQHCLRPLAWFYRHSESGNPIFGDKKVLEQVLRAGDAMVLTEKESRHGGTLHGEWIPYNLIECWDWLGEELGPERRARWREALARHIERQRLTSNFIATAPNHFIWRAAVWARAGKLFEQPEWLRAARMLARQVCKAQMPDGYWDEAHRGHGPSPNYHRVHLHGLDLYCRNSGDEEVLPALERAIDFGVRAAYPDGTPIETFDGRQPYLAAFAAGMAGGAFSRTPEGRRLLRNQAMRAEKLGLCDATNPCGFALAWYAFATTDFLLDGFRFLTDGVETPLPSERDGNIQRFAMGGSGQGAASRHGTWTVAVSAIESDVPRFIPNVYIAERQSGFSLFHADAGLLVGGGNRMRNHVPLANAILLTGWQDVDCRAGIFSASVLEEYKNAAPPGTEQAPFSAAGLPRPGHEGIDPVKCCYHPIRRRLEANAACTTLFLEFLHGTIRFEVRALDDRRAEIGYAFETCGVRKILLQVPVPLFFPGRFACDGREENVGGLETVRTVPLRDRLELSAQGQLIRYRLAENAASAFTLPLEPIKNDKLQGINYAPDPLFKPLYTVGLISREFTQESCEGLLVTVEVAAD